MTFHTISAINHGSAGWVGTVTDAKGNELYRTGRYYTSAQAAFTQAFMWAEKQGEKSHEQ